MRKISIYRKYIGQAGILLLMLMFPVPTFAEVIDIRIQGFDDGVKSTKQQDYEEAVLFAKRQAIERAGVKIKSKTIVENLILQKDYIEAQSEGVLLPGYQIMDIGYLETGTYSIILIGKIKTLDTKVEAEAEGYLDAKWGMSLSQVKEALNYLFTDPSVTVKTSPAGKSLTATTAKKMFFTNCMVEEVFDFNFMNDKLYRVNYMAQNPPILSEEKGDIAPQCGALILHLFNKQEDDLYKKYEKPIKSEEYKKIWVLSFTTITAEFTIILKNIYMLSVKYEKR